MACLWMNRVFITESTKGPRAMGCTRPFAQRLESTRLKRVAQAELELTFRCVGVAFRIHPAKRAARRRDIRIVKVWMVGVIKPFGLEDQLMVFMIGDNVECFLQSCRITLEARPIDQAA